MQQPSKIHQDILDILYDRDNDLLPYPIAILLPRRMYSEFEAEVQASRHDCSVWDIPVQEGDVDQITLLVPFNRHQVNRLRVPSTLFLSNVLKGVLTTCALWLWANLGIQFQLPVIPVLAALAVTLVLTFLLADWLAQKLVRYNKKGETLS